MPRHGQIEKRQGANLPHWRREGGTYAVTFRLADSLPQAAIDRLRAELKQIDRQAKHGTSPLSLEELVRQSKSRTDLFLQLLDEGHGECVLAEDGAAKIVAQALAHFDAARYRLHAWCVMPNHVHVVVEPLPGFDLSGILHSWKSFTANAINQHLGRSGGLWQRESYDHLIRDEADFLHHVNYVRENPSVAGLRNWKWVG